MPVDFIALQQRVIIKTFSKIESSYNPLIYNKEEGAAGLLQIRPIMLHHINKICNTTFTLQDRFDSLKSTQMFFLYQYYYNPQLKIENASRLWNAGDRGMHKPKSTQGYYERIRKEFIKVASQELQKLDIKQPTIIKKHFPNFGRTYTIKSLERIEAN